MSAHLSDPFTAVSVVEPSVRRLGERTCVLNLGAVYVAAREARVVNDIERLMSDGAWELHRSVTRALRALLSAPVD